MFRTVLIIVAILAFAYTFAEAGSSGRSALRWVTSGRSGQDAQATPGPNAPSTAAQIQPAPTEAEKAAAEAAKAQPKAEPAKAQPKAAPVTPPTTQPSAPSAAPTTQPSTPPGTVRITSV